MALDKSAEQIQESQELMGIKKNELQQVLLGLMLGSFSGAFLKTALRITLPLLTLTGISVAVTSLETVSDFASGLPVANAKFWFISFVFVSSAAAGVWESLEKVAQFRAAMDATEDNQSEGDTNGLPDPFDLTHEKALSNELEKGTDEVEELLNNVETILERWEKDRLA